MSTAAGAGAMTMADRSRLGVRFNLVCRILRTSHVTQCVLNNYRAKNKKGRDVKKDY